MKHMENSMCIKFPQSIFRLATISCLPDSPISTRLELCLAASGFFVGLVSWEILDHVQEFRVKWHSFLDLEHFYYLWVTLLVWLWIFQLLLSGGLPGLSDLEFWWSLLSETPSLTLNYSWVTLHPWPWTLLITVSLTLKFVISLESLTLNFVEYFLVTLHPWAWTLLIILYSSILKHPA